MPQGCYYVDSALYVTVIIHLEPEINVVLAVQSKHYVTKPLLIVFRHIDQQEELCQILPEFLRVP